ncbi:hypothetical protein M422DRAFT_24971 [Sphaerobolus stellatus SS14]|nr:hypothetical protein M422DRAFT_24971 [Sphaerobolus stellatus SS14]
MTSSSPLANSALLLIDLQKGFDTDTIWFGLPPRSTPSFEKNVTALLSQFRTLGCPNIIHVFHSSTHPDSPLHPSNKEGHAFAAYGTPLPGELLIEKNVNSAFIGTNLEQIIRERGIEKLFVLGLTSDHCVSTTIRMAGNLGVANEIILIGDATATFGKADWDAETVKSVHLASLNHEFCIVKNTEDVLKSLNHL